MKSGRFLSFEEALIKLESFCAYQERCSFEVLEKAKGLGLETDQCKKILEILQKKKFVDDERFAHAYANGKFRFKNWGRIKIKFELKGKRIADEFITAALYSIDEDNYFQELQNLAIRKWKEIKGKSDYERKAKLFRFLQSKGFESELITKALKSLDVN